MGLTMYLNWYVFVVFFPFDRTFQGNGF